MKIEIDIDQKTIEEIKNDSSTPSRLKKVLENQPKLKWNEITSFEDACFNLGIDPIEELGNEKKLHRIAAIKLETITLAINEGVVLDWSNTNQKKWYPWFKLKNHKPEAAKNGVSSSGRFSLYDCLYAYVNALVGSRMCFVSEEKACYAGEKFIELYNQIL